MQLLAVLLQLHAAYCAKARQTDRFEGTVGVAALRASPAAPPAAPAAAAPAGAAPAAGAPPPFLHPETQACHAVCSPEVA